MLKVKKIILFLILNFLIFGGVNASYIEPIDKIGEYKESNISENIVNIGNIKIKYNIGLNNQITRENLFFPINLKFSEKTSGNLKIYKEKIFYKYGEEKLEGEELYKTINFKNIKEFNSFFYKTQNSYRNQYKYYFYLNINNSKIKLNITNNDSYFDNNLYITNIGKTIQNGNKNSISEFNDGFLLKQFSRIYLLKNKISKKELDILKNYIFKGGDLILNKKQFEIFFGKNEKIRRINYSDKECDNYRNCNEKNKDYYSYGFGNIFIEQKYHYINNESKKLFDKNEIKKMLIDKVIESKFVPFNIILYFVIIYFISLLVINFIFGKKLKKNKFFLFYSIPATSVIGLVIIFSISIYYKGFNDIENKIQINYHIDGKILKEVYSTTFSANGGNYKIKIDKNDFNINKNENSNYRKTFSKKELIYNNGKIEKKYYGFNSSGLINFSYSSIEKETNKNIEGINIKDKNELLEIFKKGKIKNENITSYNFEDKSALEVIDPFFLTKLENNEEVSENISKIILRKEKTEYMKKYSYGGIKNKNFIIDVYYK